MALIQSGLANYAVALSTCKRVAVTRCRELFLASLAQTDLYFSFSFPSFYDLFFLTVFSTRDKSLAVFGFAVRKWSPFAKCIKKSTYRRKFYFSRFKTRELNFKFRDKICTKSLAKSYIMQDIENSVSNWVSRSFICSYWVIENTILKAMVYFTTNVTRHLKQDDFAYYSYSWIQLVLLAVDGSFRQHIYGLRSRSRGGVE